MSFHKQTTGCIQREWAAHDLNHTVRAECTLMQPFIADLDALDEAQFARCATLQRQPERIRSATLFPWWPKRIKKRQGPRRT
jgi:hypothetical protein